ncbi:DUF4421 family protein, partial [Stenotrophomonas maltophilia]
MSLQTSGDDLSYSPTNRNFYFLDMKVNDFSFQVKAPIRDPQESLQTRGDSKIIDIQMALPLVKSWHAEMYYQNVNGYFAEQADFGISLPDLEMTHIGGQLFYVFNPKYSYMAVQGTSSDQTKDAGSW